MIEANDNDFLNGNGIREEKEILKIKTREWYKYDRKPGKEGGVEPF